MERPALRPRVIKSYLSDSSKPRKVLTDGHTHRTGIFDAKRRLAMKSRELFGSDFVSAFTQRSDCLFGSFAT